MPSTVCHSYFVRVDSGALVQIKLEDSAHMTQRERERGGRERES